MGGQRSSDAGQFGTPNSQSNGLRSSQKSLKRGANGAFTKYSAEKNNYSSSKRDMQSSDKKHLYTTAPETHEEISGVMLPKATE